MGVKLTRLVETLLYPPGSLDVYKGDMTDNFTVTMPTGDVLTSTLTNSTNSKTNGTAEWPLSQHLKYPCAGRAQKLYNVQIALSALDGVKEAKPSLDGLKAEDIVDGHREKSVRLLWALVGRWGLDHLVDFELVEREIKRLRRLNRVRNLRFDANGMAASNTARGEDTEDEDINQMADVDPPVIKKSTTDLLKSWAVATCNLHGVHVHNLSTSFADGEAYRAIIQEYAPYLGLPGSTANPAPRTSTSISTSSTQHPHTRTLKSLGCSTAFTALFQPTPNPPTSHTTLPLLSFLSSRLLPAAHRGIAAVAIQRAWRAKRMLFEVRRRVVCKRLAGEAAKVVEGRERLVWLCGFWRGGGKGVCWK